MKISEEQFDAAVSQAIWLFEQLGEVRRQLSEWPTLQGGSMHAAECLDEARLWANLVEEQRSLEEQIGDLAQDLESWGIPWGLWIRSGNRRIRLIMGWSAGHPKATIQLGFWKEKPKDISPENFLDSQVGSENVQ